MPSLVRDMVDPSQFDKMIDYAFLVATAVYATIGVAGYLMFGDSVSDEVGVVSFRASSGLTHQAVQSRLDESCRV